MSAPLAAPAAGPAAGKPLRDGLCTVGLLLAGSFLLRWASGSLNGYQIQLLNLIAINAILALSLNFIYGFSGMFSLGHAGFMAVGAYVSALCILTPAQKATIWFLEPIVAPLATLQTSFFASVMLGGLVAALFSLLIAAPVLRLGGDYLGIATLGFAEIIRVLLTNLVPVTNGAIGLRGIPSHANLFWNYAWLVITLYVILSILKSNFGNVLKSIRDDDIAAKTMGINTTSYRTMAFCVGGFFAGVGGALMGSLITTIEPKMFNFQLTFNILLIVVAGGLGSVTGSVVGSAVITLLLEGLRIVEYPFNIDLDLGLFRVGPVHVPGVPGMRMVIFALVLMFIIIFRRQGLIGTRELSWRALFALPSKIRGLVGRKDPGAGAGG
ncbi:MAG: branched-chain amino acid ABC transporter permease [Deltaproteobacteria bacterium]|jgi:branched-chain amino acid transport system permease protein|nr:branched-chain amino acid ABC transporter permease [Deltaproteobacteria bacterium]